MSFEMIPIRVVLLTALAAGCQTHAASCDSDASIAAAQHAWQARHLTDYRFVWQQSCFCLPDAVQPIEVTVQHGEIVSTTDRNGVAVSDDVRKNLMTIDALYRYVDAAQCTADIVQVTAGNGGVPTRIFIDPRRTVADDEFDVTISELIDIAP